MSVMRVAGGAAAEPLSRRHRLTLAAGVGVALLAHGAILYAVLQARAGRIVVEPATDSPLSMEMAPAYRPPPPPPPKPAAPAAKALLPAPSPTPEPAVQTRAATLQSPVSDLTADPLGALTPTAGTEPVASPTAAGAAATPKPAPVIRAADWSRRPTAADMARFYPDRAQRVGVEGSTLLSCTVSLAGAAENCRVVRETPANLGFGDAALKLAKSFRFRPMLVDGQPKADGPIQIPLGWKLQ